MRLSVIIPVYNRQQELEALLISLSLQDIKSGYEIIIVDDGSPRPPEEAVQKYTGKAELTYVKQGNQGPGPARNTGAAKSKGDWLLFLDSDCELPATYMSGVFDAITKAEKEGITLIGGPDSDRDDFTILQKAINYAMTSPLTTGGIRGSERGLDKYYPRSFNMLVQASAFKKAGGFDPLRFGEDLDLSMRLISDGQHSLFDPTLKVYHRRRTSLKAFFKQVFNSGMARIVLNLRHKGTLKLVHALPSVFLILLIAAPLLIAKVPALLYFGTAAAFVLILHAFINTNNLLVSALSLITSIVQLAGYGAGFLVGWYKFMLRKQPVEYAFLQKFYE